MKQYIIHLMNTKTGGNRDVIMNAASSFHASMICEQCCLRNNEKVMCSYPKEMEPSSNGI